MGRLAWGEDKRPPALVSTETVKKLSTTGIGTGLREHARPGTPKTEKYALGGERSRGRPVVILSKSICNIDRVKGLAVVT